MLNPEIISKKETTNILKLISLLAQNPNSVNYYEQTTSQDKYLSKKINNFLNKSNIYQYQLPELKNIKIVLSKKIYKKLIKLAKNSNNLNNEEYGCYLFGKKDNTTIYFNKINKKQSPRNINTFKTTPSMQKEILHNMNHKNIDFICHVHTHSNDFNTYSKTPSNQDLYLYAWLQEQLSNDNTNFIGALITPTEYNFSFNDLCFIFYNKDNKKFYKITNIYYLDKSKEIPLDKINIKNGHIERKPILLKI